MFLVIRLQSFGDISLHSFLTNLDIRPCRSAYPNYCGILGPLEWINLVTAAIINLRLSTAA